ncbi:MAG: thioredoxin domain-containing protein [Candidatus Paceibacterota bacterium]
MLRIFCFLLVVVLSFNGSSVTASAQVVGSTLTDKERQDLLSQIVELMSVVKKLQLTLTERQRLENNNDYTKTQIQTQAQASSQSTLEKDDHIRGNPFAPNKFIVYSDMECPFCSSFHQSLINGSSAYFSSGKFTWVYRHFPLVLVHPSSKKAALASECVNEYGGNSSFWTFVDFYYKARKNSPEADTEKLINQVLEENKLNTKDIKQCITEERFMYRVDDDMESGTKLGINGTPHSIIIDEEGKEQVLLGAVNYDYLRNIFDDIINKQTEIYYPSNVGFSSFSNEAKFFGDISVTQTAPSTIKITGQLESPINCINAPDHQFDLHLGNRKTKEFILDDCKAVTIDETVVLDSSLIPSYVELTLKQKEITNASWIVSVQKRFLVNTADPNSFKIINMSAVK